jgi:hypothetical protein
LAEKRHSLESFGQDEQHLVSFFLVHLLRELAQQFGEPGEVPSRSGRIAARR